MMHTLQGIRLLFLGMVIGLLGACATKETPVPEKNDMDIVVDFSEVHRCSRISPEITVRNMPENTQFYDVRLIEEGKEERYLGGGTWTEDGTGIIPEGALTRHYTGPCPSSDQETTFVYVVTAMESYAGQPLEVRLYRLKLEKGASRD